MEFKKEVILQALDTHDDKAKSKRLNIILNEDLHKELKYTALSHGVTMSEYVIALLQAALAEDKQRRRDKESKSE